MRCPRVGAKRNSLPRLHAVFDVGRMQPGGQARGFQAWVKTMSTLQPSTVGTVHGRGVRHPPGGGAGPAHRRQPARGNKLPKTHRVQVAPLAMDEVRALTEAMPDRHQALVSLAAGVANLLRTVCGPLTPLWTVHSGTRCMLHVLLSAAVRACATYRRT